MPDVDDLAQRFPAELDRLHAAVRDLSEGGRVTSITEARGKA
jgi:hypothetical protein